MEGPGITVKGTKILFDADMYSMDQAKRMMKDNGIRWDSFKPAKDMEKEVRLLNTEFRTTQIEDREVVRGMAAVYNSWSEDLGGFREMIMPGAFDGRDEDDIRALVNHDPNRLLGRTTAGTLRVASVEGGLDYEYDHGGQTYANDLLISLKRGDITQSSFSFSVAKGGAEWREGKDGQMERIINKVSRLYDVSPVTFPAYPSTTVAKRELSEIEKEKNDAAMKAEQERQADEDARDREAQLREILLKSK